MNTRHIEAVVFDLDGVLVDTEPVYQRALRALLAPDEVTDEQYAEIVGTSDEHTLRWIQKTYRRTETFEELRRRSSEFVYRELAAAPLAPLDGAIALVESLRGAGCLLAVASQSSPRWVESNLRAIGLIDRFPLVVTASEVRAGKPAPDIYLHAADRLGIPPARCLAIEDSVPGLRAAAAAGMTVVQVRQAGHVPPPQPEAHAVIASLRDFRLDWLDSAVWTSQ